MLLTKETLAQIRAKHQAADDNWIKIGMATCGVAAGADKVYQTILSEVKNSGLNIDVRIAGCQGSCYAEPLVEVKTAGGQFLYSKVDEAMARDIVARHASQGAPLSQAISSAGPRTDGQMRIAMRHCGVVDPESIESYIGQEGYQALFTTLTERKPEDVIAEMEKSRLRGRGGAGFPTHMKWSLALRSKTSETKYIICNADEGDPGAYMDRSVLEGDPHAVVEGMILGGYAIGACKGFFYVRAEYPLAVKRLQIAIDQCREYGVLGKNIFGSGFDFDIEIRLGAGAFVCGEETALIASLEGRRGTPRPRPPFPTDRGAFDKPSVINNVETLTNVSAIMLKGGAWYGAIGTEKSSGTKVFAVTGKVKNSGLVEIPMGTPLRKVVFDICGGILDDKKFLAVQTGGPSGGVITEEFLDVPITYESLGELGSIMGSGGMIVMNEDDCIVDIAKFYLGFCVDESCGKCAPCRIGGKKMLGILERISAGKGEPGDIAKLKQICLAMQKASLCGLGQTAPNPVVSTLRYFAEEYRMHIEDKKCRAGVCKKLLKYTIVEDKCVKCGLCQKRCPADAITGDRKSGFAVVQEKCVKCGACMDACKFDAVTRA